MNRIIFALAAAGICLGSCTSLTFQEKQELSALEYRGITVDRAPGGFYKYGNGGIPDFPGLEAAGRRTMPQQRVAPRQVPYRTQETAPRQVPYRSRYHQAPRGYYNNYQTYGY